MVAAAMLCAQVTAQSFTIPQTTVPQGGKTELVVHYQFDTEGLYTGYQFDIALPAGFTLTHDASNNLTYTLGDCYASTHMMVTNYVTAEDVYNCTCMSILSDPLTGTSGVLIKLEINADASVEVGQTYTGTLQNMHLAKVNGQDMPLANATFALVVGEPVDTRVFLNEESTVVPDASSGPVDIVVQRTIKSGQWSTICLPFAMTETQVHEVFGDDVQVKEFIDYTVTEDDATGAIFQITVNFADADLATYGMEANFPYLIQTSQDLTEFEVNSTIEPDEDGAVVEYDNGKTGSRRVVYGSLIGTYHAQTVVPENCLFISGNKFWYSTGLTKMKAYRAYFDFVDVLDDLDSAGANISMVFDSDEVTGIEEMNSTGHRIDNGVWYTLDGRRTVAKPTQKGVYINNGKKMVIK